MKFITYGAYVWFPILASLSWCGTLLGLLLLWLIRDHHRKYGHREATVVFISDVGGTHLWLFIPGCAIVFTFYSLSLFAERWLRHADRIPGTIRIKSRNWGIVSLLTGCLGGFWLLMLACFNTFSHPTLHWSFTLLFIIFVGASAISQTLEILYLHQDHPDILHLRRNVFIKLSIVSLAILIAIIFGILYGTCKGKATSHHCNVVISAAGVCEWLVSSILIFYFVTFILDLWPAAKTSPRHQRRIEMREQRILEKQKVVEHVSDKNLELSNVVVENQTISV
ncbi:hypothetical protein CROQUDRAFT_56726 [Cronartium quercuum f. sp. fusiforme G11]|uniref:CWH43-like N-terminal domain-containing protein n=1 Tax=Cronartium quercuum f. sp. fusiforme G11 TaxID=708437 RepID=A0A9P6TG81_9BASI|nr:hypothetical protein CROQUDRAFT_56726 [Cronartium quercuum f. sp. fusiforme G11]